MKGTNCHKLPLNVTEEDKGQIQEETARLADAQISLDAAVARVLSKRSKDCIAFTRQKKNKDQY